MNMTTPHRHGTILLLENDSTVRTVTQLALSAYGYAVLAAANGPEALVVWAAHRADINVIIAEVAMPGPMSGIKFAQRVKAEKPEVKLIITSACGMEVADLDSALAAPMVCLAKPFTPETLIEAIERCPKQT
jgi:two-component system, cell cycle sensor histidine kinase and response regulator CckA